MKRWSWLLVALGVPVLGGALFVAWGTTLPVEHTAVATTDVTAPPDVVYDLITDPRRGPEWRADVQRVEIQSDRRWIEHGEEPLILEVRTADRPRRFTTEVVEHPAFGGTWTWELQSNPDGTHVILTEDGVVYDPFFRAVMTAMSWESANIETRLAELNDHFGKTRSSVNREKGL
ncbi:MAG: SRPBCC family protein [Myxococcota bacterium]